MIKMMINRKVLRVELHSDDLDLLNDVADAIDKIVDEYYPSVSNEKTLMFNDSDDCKDCCNLLNELHKENTKLALQVRMLEQVKPIRKIPKSIDVVLKWDDNDKISKLEKENEQLKKQLNCFKPLIFETDGKPITLYEKKG